MDQYRKDFPQLNRDGPNGPPIYFDNSCMTLKPNYVIDAIVRYYRDFGACGGRSLHKLSTGVTIEMDRSRKLMADFLGTKDPREVIYTKNTTEALNLLARSLDLKKGDLVITSDREHNSNLVPWLHMKDLRGIDFKVVPSKDDATFDLDKFSEMVKTAKLVSMVHTSNLDGYTLPIKEITEIAHDAGALVMIDGAQAIPHMDVNVVDLDVDFYTLSVHKMCGPTGMGVLYGRFDLLKEMTPFIVGGDTVERATYDECKFLEPPNRFEAGLQNYAGMFGTAAAVEYLTQVGRSNIHAHELKLNKRVHEILTDMPEITIVGVQDPALRGGITGFTVDGFDIHDIAIILDETANIMMRSGLHCVHGWFKKQGIKGSARVSSYLYNTIDEVERFGSVMGELLGH